MDLQPLVFFVTALGDVQFLEASPQSWTQLVEERSRRKARV